MGIRPESPEDAQAIHRVVEEAFAGLAHSRQTEARIVAGLRDAGALAVSLVAVDDDAVVGQIAFSPVLIDGQPRGWYGLGPVAVRPAWQRRGIGTMLIRDGLRRLENMGAAGCVLLGSPNYYRRFGFENDPALRYDAAPAQYFMKLLLAGPAVAGRVTFHEAFDVS